MLSSPAGVDTSRPFSTFDLASRSTVIAAVSGGSDSTALLLLLKDYLDRSAPGTRLVAATVDHALRPDSAAEAQDVAQLCARHAIAHVTLVWDGPKPATGLAAAARETRYRLLAEAAVRAQTDLVLTGHTCDDQAETVLMRSARDKGRGLAGMAPATLYDGRIWIARPLLGCGRKDLRTFLVAQGVGWIDDPTNENQAYERPRVRSRLADEASDGRIEAALKQAAAAANWRKQLGEAAADLIREHAGQPAPGLIRIDRALFEAGEQPAAIYALRILLACTGGTPFLPDEARTAALFGRIAAGPVRAVLSRALVDARRNGVFLHREARSLPAPVAPESGMIWDGRYRIVAADRLDEGLTIAAFPVKTADIAEIDTVPNSLLRAASAAQPAAWWRNGECAGLVPEAGDCAGLRREPLLAPWARFLPSFDLAPAKAIAELLGAAKLPEPPFRRHNERKP